MHRFVRLRSGTAWVAGPAAGRSEIEGPRLVRLGYALTPSLSHKAREPGFQPAREPGLQPAKKPASQSERMPASQTERVPVFPQERKPAYSPQHWAVGGAVHRPVSIAAPQSDGRRGATATHLMNVK